jgi:hypothetical protein
MTHKVFKVQIEGRNTQQSDMRWRDLCVVHVHTLEDLLDAEQTALVWAKTQGLKMAVGESYNNYSVTPTAWRAREAELVVEADISSGDIVTKAERLPPTLAVPALDTTPETEDDFVPFCYPMGLLIRNGLMNGTPDIVQYD